jgi:MFS transporter, DHA1 family, inner membrane transport protein
MAQDATPKSPAEQVPGTTGTTRRERFAVAMFALLLLSYVVNAMDRQVFPVLGSDVQHALGFSLPQLGLLSTIFTLGLGVAGLPTGYLLARVSRRAVVLSGLVLFSAATALTAVASGFWDLLVYRLVSGIGEAMQLTALLAIGTAYFVQHRGAAAGSLNFSFGVGATLGPILGAAILAATNWRVPLVLFGLVGLLLFVIIGLAVRPWLTEARGSDQRVVRSGGADRITRRDPMLLAAATVLAGLAIYGYLGLYPTYLRAVLGFSPQQAALAASMFGLGALLSLLGGWLGDRFDFRTLLAVSLGLAAICGYVLFSGIHSLAAHLIGSFVFGAAISGMVYVNLAAGIIKSVRTQIAGQGSGLFVASLYIPAAFAGYLLGWLAVHVGWGTAALIQLSGFSVLAAILARTARRPTSDG